MRAKSNNRESEAALADWFDTPAGRREAARTMRAALRKGKIVVDKQISSSEARQLAQTGKVVVLKKGLAIKRTDPAKLAALLADARASMTQAISLRISIADLDVAKEIAKRKGVGYQTIIKQALHAGLGTQL